MLELVDAHRPISSSMWDQEKKEKDSLMAFMDLCFIADTNLPPMFSPTVRSLH